MKAYTLLAIALLTSACALAGGTTGGSPQQWGRIAVTVQDAATHQPIAGAAIAVDNAGHALTDALGAATVQVEWYVKNAKHDALGDYTEWNVWVDKAGFVSLSNRSGVDGGAFFVTVRPAETTRLAVAMKGLKP